jgi:hypothetical protein
MSRRRLIRRTVEEVRIRGEPEAVLPLLGLLVQALLGKKQPPQQLVIEPEERSSHEPPQAAARHLVSQINHRRVRPLLP